MIWENDIETCIISHMKRIASPGSMHDPGCLGLVHWDDPEGWYGEGGRGSVWRKKKKKENNKFSFKNQPPEVLRWLRDRMGIPLSPPRIQQRII